MKRFWNFIRDENGGRILRLEGPIDEDNFWGDEVTPKAFRDELEAEDGDVTVYINSPGGNVFAAAEIYTMLIEHKGRVTVKVDAIAASAASVIAMAGDTVLMSPVAMLMLHDPMTVAMGNAKDMEKAIATLNEVKESIINAYHAKSGLNRKKISQIMEDETWLNAKRAVELGFADGIIERGEPKDDEGDEDDGKEIEAIWKPYSTRIMGQRVLNRIVSAVEKPARTDEEHLEAACDKEDVEQAEEGMTEDAAAEALPDTVAEDPADIPVEDTADAADISDKDKPKETAPGGSDPDKDDDPDGDESEGDPDSPDEPDKNPDGDSDGDDPKGDEPVTDDPDDPDKEDPKAKPDEGKPKDAMPEEPVIGMDGRTKDGAMPYELVRKQLDFLK